MNSGMIVKAPHDATVTYVDATRIILDHNIIFKLRKYVGLNERTCLNQKPIVKVGQKVKLTVFHEGKGKEIELSALDNASFASDTDLYSV